MNQLPKWIWGGTAILAYNAGWINAIGISGFHMPVSHATGSISNTVIGLNISMHENFAVWVLLAFFLGSVISGAIIHNDHLSAGRRYGFALVIESLLLIIGMHLFLEKSINSMLLYAMACGLQNAMFALYSGSVIRTTHMTGLVSDLGIQIGNLFTGKSFDKNRLKLHFTILSGFVAGLWSSSYLFNSYLFICLLVPILITVSIANIYIFKIKPKYCLHAKKK